MTKNYLMIICLGFCANLSLAEQAPLYQTINNDNFLTITSVDTETQIGQYQYIQFQLAADGRWDLNGYKVTRPAKIDTLEIKKLGTFPEQILLVVTGQKTKPSCRESIAVNKHDLQSDSLGNNFRVAINLYDVLHFSPCIPPSSFQETIPLDVYGLGKGIYQVFVNDKTGSFELTQDNE